MSSLFKAPTINMPAAPTPTAPPPMPDPFSPAAAEAAKASAAARAGRSSTMLTTRSAAGASAPRTIAGGGSVPYSGATLGGAR